MSEAVNHPTHYNAGTLEVIDAIKGLFTQEAYCGFLAGNVIKYISRYKYKGGLEDLEKGAWYLNKLIEETKAQKPDAARLTHAAENMIKTLEDFKSREKQEREDPTGEPWNADDPRGGGPKVYYGKTLIRQLEKVFIHVNGACNDEFTPCPKDCPFNTLGQECLMDIVQTGLALDMEAAQAAAERLVEAINAE